MTATPFKRNSFYTENPLIQIEKDDAPELVIPDSCVDIIYHIDYTDNTVTGGFCRVNDCSFLADVNIYEEEQTDGRIFRSLKFRFHVFFNGKEIYELDWDHVSTVETVVLMSRVDKKIG